MEFMFCNGNNKEYQVMLNDLLKDIFYDFRFWYDLNLWDENYESYSLVEKEEIISNVCVYKTQVLLRGSHHLTLSVGAVATKDGYRGRGLSRMLMEHIIDKYEGVPMYLFAHEGVADFYPKFGFKRLYEKQPVCNCVINNDIRPIKLDYNDPKVWSFVSQRVNFSQELDCLNTARITMFHIHVGYLKDHIYEIPGLQTLVIASQEGSTLKLFGVFSLKDVFFCDLVQALPFANVQRIEFGFMPPWPDLHYNMEERAIDPIFARGVTCTLGDLKFPELSTT